ncbi:XRE family transcriptional regulator [Rhodococcus erythropolis]|jgi:transcriptional regulator with XRE-family HTH domain|uniref:XRE family transcriptional regulator n=1 Tax=Rhodococcus erythropolis TaxID=1833 RepID=A0A5N5DZQ5_RHOER|nr:MULTISPECIES: helix-turn-helix transcriptional regulator [Rhodococcus]KAB2582941.1 XRE family transcriptional regulator [Rhodococcus erythropolis]MBP1054182.1 helix-turn-helix domain-containing protein [Rhodococcus qingshengii]MBY6389245.1 helix-turn-helix domain-containing protein [Rhodococcus erythropolis]MDV8128955.1 helix-turn-helix transcriptional regulator [Rhodococcus sp. IEGM 1304]MEA1798713.1 helix-turn-helix transcriptional regulator [Rhodococcus qingshengii]
MSEQAGDLTPGVDEVPRSGVRGFRADRLRELRVKAGLTPDDLSVRLGSSRQSVSHWETGRSTPAPPVLKQIAQELDVSISVLVPIPDNRLRMGDLRVRAGLTQIQAAERLGISPTSLAEIEKGMKPVNDQRVSAIAELYNVETAQVVEVWERGRETRETRARSK